MCGREVERGCRRKKREKGKGGQEVTRRDERKTDFCIAGRREREEGVVGLEGGERLTVRQGGREGRWEEEREGKERVHLSRQGRRGKGQVRGSGGFDRSKIGYDFVAADRSPFLLPGLFLLSTCFHLFDFYIIQFLWFYEYFLCHLYFVRLFFFHVRPMAPEDFHEGRCYSGLAH